MALLDAFRPVSALTDLLDKEKEALLKSDFSTLRALAKPKENLMAMIAKSQVPAESLSALQKRIEGNQRLLMASAKGSKSDAHCPTQPANVERSISSPSRANI